MEIKAIVLDLDGTVLNTRKQVTEYTAEMILKCHAQGIQIIFATARPPRSLKMLLPPELQQLGYCIYYNGALTVRPDDSILESHNIPSVVSSELYRFIYTWSSSLYFCVESDDRIYSDRVLSREELAVFGIPANGQDPLVITPAEMHKISATKILLPNRGDIYSKLQSAYHSAVHIIRTDGKTLIQIMNKNAAKENALILVLDCLGISLHETMVFGDDYNDLGLFKVCGYPVAMGNAIDELKKLAVITTTSNDDEGVAAILENLLACKEKEIIS